MHDNLNKGRRSVIEQSLLSFSRISSLAALSKEDPSLLPALVKNLCNLKLGICLGLDGQVVVISENNERFLLAGVNEDVLSLSILDDPSLVVSSTSGFDLFETIAEVNSRERSIGLIFQFGELKEGSLELDSLTIPSRLFKPKLDIFKNPVVSIISAVRKIEAAAKRDLTIFFNAYPEIQKAYYAERIKNGDISHLIILQTGSGEQISDQFLLTTPALILEKHGFNPNNIWVVCSKPLSNHQLPIQEIYSI